MSRRKATTAQRPLSASQSRSTPDLSRPLLIDSPPKKTSRRMTYKHPYYGSKPPWAVDEEEDRNGFHGESSSPESEQDPPPFAPAGGPLARDDANARKRRIQAARQLYRTPESRSKCAGSVDDLLKAIERPQATPRSPARSPPRSPTRPLNRESSSSAPDGLAPPRVAYRTTRGMQTPRDVQDAGVGTEAAALVVEEEVAEEAGTPENSERQRRTFIEPKPQPTEAAVQTRPKPPPAEAAVQTRSKPPPAVRMDLPAERIAPARASRNHSKPPRAAARPSKPNSAKPAPRRPTVRAVKKAAALKPPAQASRPSSTVGIQTEVTGEDFARALAVWSDDSLEEHDSDYVDPIVVPRQLPLESSRPRQDPDAVREALERLETACQSLTSTARSVTDEEGSVGTDEVTPIRRVPHVDVEAYMDRMEPRRDVPDHHFLGLADLRAYSPVFGSMPMLHSAEVLPAPTQHRSSPGLPIDAQIDALERARRSRSLDDIDLDKIFGAGDARQRRVPMNETETETDRRINFWLYKSIYYERNPRLLMMAGPDRRQEEVDVSFEDTDSESLSEDTLDEEEVTFVASRPIEEERRKKKVKPLTKKSVDFKEEPLTEPTIEALPEALPAPNFAEPEPETPPEPKPQPPPPPPCEIEEAPPSPASPRSPKPSWPTPPVKRVQDDQLPPEIRPRTVAERAKMFAQFAATAESRREAITPKRAPRPPPPPAHIAAEPAPPLPAARESLRPVRETPPVPPPSPRREVEVIRAQSNADDFRRRPKTKSIFLTAPAAQVVTVQTE